MKIAITAGFAALSLCGAALAQEAAPAAAPAAPAASADAAKNAAALGVTPDEVNKMGVLNYKVGPMMEAGQAKIAAAPEDQRAALQNTMYQDLGKLVTDTGLTLDRYNAIAQLAGANPALASEIAAAGAQQQTAVTAPASGAAASTTAPAAQ